MKSQYCYFLAKDEPECYQNCNWAQLVHRQPGGFAFEEAQLDIKGR
jgi:hypothetical protein